MKNKAIDDQNYQFPIRRDQNGLRVVFKLGNENGNCPFQCRFCGVGKSPKVSSDENIRRFNSMYAKYLQVIDGPYNANVFNRGNVTNSREFAKSTLNHILECFENDKRVTYVSLNSREKTASPAVLDYLIQKNLSFPIHFIFGAESFSPFSEKILGKKNNGELEKFIQKLKNYNHLESEPKSSKKYIFGLEVSLLFLPELYLKPSENRKGNFLKIRQGIINDLKQLLALIDPEVPVGINIHPFYSVESLPYKDVDLNMLIDCLPALQVVVEQHNRLFFNCKTHLFLGVIFLPDIYDSYANEHQKKEIFRLKSIVDQFNRTGKVKEK